MDTKWKRSKSYGEEDRLHRSRERNRMHARKTRERKKIQAMALQQRIEELQDEGSKLRQVIDEHYTAQSLLGLRGVGEEGARVSPPPSLTSNQVCGDYYNNMLRDGGAAADTADGAEEAEEGEVEGEGLSLHMNSSSGSDRKNMRAKPGSHTPQERDRIRKERNRLHAKKTRDRKKLFLESSGLTIHHMEREVQELRDYVSRHGLLSEQQLRLIRGQEARDWAGWGANAGGKRAMQTSYEDDGEYEDMEEGDDDHNEEDEADAHHRESAPGDGGDESTSSHTSSHPTSSSGGTSQEASSRAGNSSSGHQSSSRASSNNSPSDSGDGSSGNGSTSHSSSGDGHDNISNGSSRSENGVGTSAAMQCSGGTGSSVAGDSVVAPNHT
eukprot:gene29573-35698_t